MSRLPKVGGDEGNWGDILNDYLAQAHNPDGTLRDGSISEDQLDTTLQSKIDNGTVGPAGPPSVVLLEENDPDPDPVQDGVLYLRIVAAGVPDTTAPSIPTGLATSAVADTSFTASWDASSDNVGVTGYQVRLDGGAPVTVTSLNHNFTNLTAETEYSVDVRARDAAGNWSNWSSAVQVTTLEEDAEPQPGTLIWEDTFNRSDGPAGNGWTPIAPLAGANIVNNMIEPSGGSGYRRLINAGSGTLPDNCTIRFGLTAARRLNNFFGIMARGDSDGENALKVFWGSNFTIYDGFNGSASTWSASEGNLVDVINSQAESDWSSGNTVELRVDLDGANIRVYINDNQIGSGTTSIRTAGGTGRYVGFCGELSEAPWDYIRVETLPS